MYQHDCTLKNEEMNQIYVIDGDGRIWLALTEYNYGMFTRSDKDGKIWSVGINHLKDHHGPILQFSAKSLITSLDEQQPSMDVCMKTISDYVTEGHVCQCFSMKRDHAQTHECKCGNHWSS